MFINVTIRYMKIKGWSKESGLISKGIFEVGIANVYTERTFRILRRLAEDIESSKLLPLSRCHQK